MPNIVDLVQPQFLASAWDATKEQQDAYLGLSLFPAKKQAGMKIEMIKGVAGLPVSLVAGAFDAHAPFRGRLGLEMGEAKMAFFRERMKVDEETRQQIMLLQQAQSPQIAQYIENIFNDALNLIAGARVVAERMIMQLISTGKIRIESNGIIQDYDYGFAKHQFATPAKPWSDPTSLPLADIDKMLTAFKKKTNISLTRCVMTSTTFDYLKSNTSLLALVYKERADYSGLFITKQQIKDIISQYTGVQIAEYNEVYCEAVGGDAKTFFPDGVVSFLPNGTLGNMYYGVTPEEANRNSSGNSKYNNTSTNAEIVEQGIAVQTMVNEHPVEIEILVSAMMLPSLNNMGSNILIAQVA